MHKQSCRICNRCRNSHYLWKRNNPEFDQIMKQMCEELNPVEAHNDEETEIMELDNESSNGSTEFEMSTSVQAYHQLLSVQTDNVCEIPVKQTCEGLNSDEIHNDEQTEIMELDDESSSGSTEYEW
ncbi:unnamed protein product, partial [Didymodactylos carnosus]